MRDSGRSDRRNRIHRFRSFIAGLASILPLIALLPPPAAAGGQIQILSPTSGQAVTGDLQLKVAFIGIDGQPQVNLDWFWCPTVAPGAWPEPEQQMQVVNAFVGKTEITVPREKFVKQGRWHLRVSTALAANLEAVDEVFFIIPVLGEPPLPPPSIKILSPTANQVVKEDLLFQIAYVNMGGSSPPITTFEWLWYPPTQPGEWPKPPERRWVINSWGGINEYLVPREKLIDHGRWSVRASAYDAQNVQRSDEVFFIVFDKLALMKEIKKEQMIHQVQPQTLQPVLPKPAAIPVIAEPLENQKIAVPGAVPLSIRLATEEADLRWEVEWKSFGDNSYSRLSPQFGSLNKIAGADRFSGQVRLEQPGQYRLRVQSLQPGALWSPWRTVVVGTPPLKKTIPVLIDKKVIAAPANNLRTGAKAGDATLNPAPAATIQNQPLVQPASPLLPKVKLQSSGPTVR